MKTRSVNPRNTHGVRMGSKCTRVPPRRAGPAMLGVPTSHPKALAGNSGQRPTPPRRRGRRGAARDAHTWVFRGLTDRVFMTAPLRGNRACPVNSARVARLPPPPYKGRNGCDVKRYASALCALS